MMPVDPWIERVRFSLECLSEPLQREVVAGLVKPRLTIPAEELVDRCLQTLTNPPVLDRRIKELPEAPRKLLTLIGLSRRPSWRCGHLVTLSTALGHSDGLNPILTLLRAGLLFPEHFATTSPITAWEEWLGSSGTLSAPLFVPPSVAARARAENLGLPSLASSQEEPLTTQSVRFADGLDWPLRLAATWQLVSAGPLRLTQSNTLFKNDLNRLQTDPILATPPPDQLLALPDSGVLALFWAMHAGLLRNGSRELTAAPFPDAWTGSLATLLVQLWGALTALEGWDPLQGYLPAEPGTTPFPTATLLLALLLAQGPANAWTTAEPLAAWLWEHHPSWSGTLPKESAKQGGQDWVELVLLGVLYPLGMVEVAIGEPNHVRLTPLARHWLVRGAAEPPAPPAFPQALLVQPNAEILAYRQGLTPTLLAQLTRFARWKGLGPACTLELTPEQTYRGLEGGLTVAGISQILSRHGMKAVPPPVTDLIRRWADKRERITVFASATLVEFPTPADLDTALARGVVAVKLTDRIGMADGGQEPDFKHLRLIGNRDYEAKPYPCLTVGADGLTLTVDPATSDLLLEAEIGKFADLIDTEPSGIRRYQLTPESLRRAARLGLSITELENWFAARSKEMLSPAAWLLFHATTIAPARISRPVVIEVDDPKTADGLEQWPTTAEFQARLEQIGSPLLAKLFDS